MPTKTGEVTTTTATTTATTTTTTKTIILEIPEDVLTYITTRFLHAVDIKTLIEAYPPLISALYPVVFSYTDKTWLSTPLCWCSRREFPEFAQILLDNGADIEEVSRNGWSPMSMAVLQGSMKMGLMLLANGADSSDVPRKWVKLSKTVDWRSIEGA